VARRGEPALVLPPCADLAVPAVLRRRGAARRDIDAATPETIAVAFTPPENALVFASFTALALLAGTLLLYWRDTN
jgi:predicted membrane-bound mannosyltransferase